MTLAELRVICVDNLPLSTTRVKIMTGLESVVAAFRKEKISQEFWVDGSFLTEKIDPKDVDVVLRIEHLQLRKLSPMQLAVIRWFQNNDLKPVYNVENYNFVEFPVGHGRFKDGQIAREYWLNQYGTDRDGFKKGIAVITS
jgi:hypothetical protein